MENAEKIYKLKRKNWIRKEKWTDHQKKTLQFISQFIKPDVKTIGLAQAYHRFCSCIFHLLSPRNYFTFRPRVFSVRKRLFLWKSSNDRSSSSWWDLHIDDALNHQLSTRSEFVIVRLRFPFLKSKIIFLNYSRSNL